MKPIMPKGAPMCFQLPAPATNFVGFAVGESRLTAPSAIAGSLLASSAMRGRSSARLAMN
jgi:hypothetical protein